MRIGLIGFGVGGSAFHAPLIAATDGLELAAVVTSNPERAGAARAKYPKAAVVAHPRELWDLGLDAVTITTPNSSHAPLAHDALDHGLNVVVDKPLATNVADAKSLVDHADEADLLLTVYLNRRWDGDFLTVAELVESGSLGKVHRFESRFERWRPQVVPSWKETTSDGGGILFDLGPHVIDQAVCLFGPVAAVYAEVGRVRADAVNDDDVFLAFTHRNGVRSHLWLSAVAADLGPRFRVLGNRGGYRIFGMDPQEAALRGGLVPSPDDARWGARETADDGVRCSGDGELAQPTQRGNYLRFYQLWAAALRGDGPVPVDPADAVATLRIIDAASRREWSVFDEEFLPPQPTAEHPE